MQRSLLRALGLATALIAAAGTAQAQGRGNGKAKHEHQQEHQREHERHDAVVVRRANGDVIVDPRHERAVPPGLAKKPGQMPPGQYKKLYNTGDGASVLSDILRQRGYTVTRLATSGNSRYVYYRLRNGTVRRAIVRPGSERLSFSNVPASILQAVLDRLY